MMSLSSEHQHALLLSAARAVRAAVLGQEAPPPPGGGVFDLPRGAFVTVLAGDGALRGCLGRTQADHPLGRVVVEMAWAAATRDPRFPPLRVEELADLHLEVSVLTVPVPCTPDDIEIGRDGLIIRRHSQSGLLLPQVAASRGWDVATFLEHCCLKAGLEPDAWQGDAVIERFEAQVFGGGLSALLDVPRSEARD